MSLKKICIHWTAGPYHQTSLDYEHYHYTIGPDGSIASGKFRPEDNIPPLSNGRYAAHCGGGNSYCIGLSLRGMAGFKDANHVGQFPLTEKQCEAAWQLAAKLCKQYGIAVTPDTVFSHYEYGKRRPKSDSAGKIDIIFLPHEPQLKANEVGNYIRQKVKWYLGQMK